jgi:hypothetical protein
MQSEISYNPDRDSESLAIKVEFILAREQGAYKRQGIDPRFPKIDGEESPSNRIWDKLSRMELLPSQIRYRMRIESQVETEIAEALRKPQGQNTETEQVFVSYLSTFTGETPDYNSRVHHLQQSGPNCLLFSTIMAASAFGVNIPVKDLISRGIREYPNVMRRAENIPTIINQLAIEGISIKTFIDGKEDREEASFQANRENEKLARIRFSNFKHHIDKGEIIIAAIRTPLQLWGVQKVGSNGVVLDESVGHAIVIEGYITSSNNEILYMIHDPLLPQGPVPVSADVLHRHLKPKYLVVNNK